MLVVLPAIMVVPCNQLKQGRHEDIFIVHA
jgi:hypothetical protein